MISKSRKFKIWLVTFIIVFVTFLIYTHFNKTPPIEIEEETSVKPVLDMDANENITKFAQGVGVGAVDIAKFVDLDPQTKQVVREWGFEKLLHQEGQEWEIDKPFMNIYRSNFKCYIDADTGRILLESGVSRPIVKTAVFSGDVIIRIFSKSSKGIMQSNIYLDDIEFNSDRSMFSTAGPIRVVSDRALMTGRGMELIYDTEQNRVELLRVFHLESLQLKTGQNTELFSKSKPADKSVEKPSENKEVLVSKDQEDGNEIEIKTTEVESDKLAEVKTEGKAKQRYKLIFNKNVVIDAAEQLILALDEFVINDIEGGEVEGEITEQDVVTAEGETAEEKDVSTEPQKVVTSQEKVIAEAVSNKTDTKKQLISPSQGQADDNFDVTVTCDGGITVVPMDNPVEYSSFSGVEDESEPARKKSLQRIKEESARTTFVTEKLDYFYSSEGIGNIVATEKSELVFYVEEKNKSDANISTVVPVNITSRKKAEFLPGQNTAIFEGSCVGRTVKEKENIRQKYTISAPKFTVILSQEQQKDDELPAIDHFVASDGVVRLSSIKTQGDEPFGGVELKCNKFDYDPSEQMFLATGPGIITFDNSRTPKTNKQAGRFSFQKPCWAFVRDFDKLEFLFEANKIIANARPHETLRIDYFPVVDGKYGQQVTISANKMVANIVKTADGGNELSRVDAQGSVVYEEEAKKTVWGTGKAIQFVGSDFTYDAKRSKITAYGSGDQPCLLNGALVEGIEYNVESGRIKTAIVGPGVLQ